MEKTADTVTLSEMEQLCKACFNKREEIDLLEANVKGLRAELEAMNARLLDYLTSLDKTNYESAVGKVTVKNIFSVSQPKSPEAKKEFYDFLRSKGIFEDLISIHSKTLNGFYKREMEIAQEEQRIDFRIPGLDEPFFKQTLSFKRK